MTLTEKHKILLLPEVQAYISQNIDENLHKLLLKKSPFSNISSQEIVAQIKGKKTARKKFPSLDIPEIIFPPQLNLEQTSSETTAQYKASLLSGNTLIDLTSGFGIDAFFLQKNFQKTILVEKNEELLAIVEHNWKVLGASATFFFTDLEDFLEKNNQNFDAIYLDPARRNQNKKKVFLLEDLSPNIFEIQNKLLQIGQKILIKLSPLIDIHYLLEELNCIQEIHLVSIKNEMKEVLILIENKPIEKENVKIICVNLETADPIFIIQYKDLLEATHLFSDVEEYLYLPNSSLQKAGAVAFLGKSLGLKKLHPNTQLLTAKTKIENFPGRVLKVQKIQPKKIKKAEKFNIISRNFPINPEQIKEKYKIKDGGEVYLIFTQSIAGKIILQSV